MDGISEEERTEILRLQAAISRAKDRIDQLREWKETLTLELDNAWPVKLGQIVESRAANARLRVEACYIVSADNGAWLYSVMGTEIYKDGRQVPLAELKLGTGTGLCEIKFSRLDDQVMIVDPPFSERPYTVTVEPCPRSGVIIF
jgi:hypothetical protein